MTLPPLFMSRPPAQRFLLAGVVPAVFGAITGVILGESAPLYWVLQVLAIIGGLLAGLEHPTAREAAVRGLAAGAVFGAFILIAHAVAGTDEKVSLGSAPILLVVITAVVGAILAALGSRVRARREPEAV
jgi:apolipoprotein N-acyltransferase